MNIQFFTEQPDERTDAILLRTLDDGREIGVRIRMYNTILFIGKAGNEIGFDDFW